MLVQVIVFSSQQFMVLVLLLVFLLFWYFFQALERIESADVPKIFQGVPIALITAGLMSMAFMGFIGLV